MKAIDRATTWVSWLEGVGFDIECETSIDIVGNEYMTVRAEKGNAKVLFTIQMDTKFTRFITGSTGYCRLGKFTRKPSQMASWVSSEREMEWLRMEQRGVTA